MDIKAICEEARKITGLSQNGLAARIGMTRSNLSGVLSGRRRLPAEAAFELEEITGIPAKDIWQAGKENYKSGLVARVATMVAVVVVTMTTGMQDAKANIDSACRNFPLSAIARFLGIQRPRGWFA